MQSEPHSMNTVVWALPRSLAATYGIIVIFSSSGYLDVSVRRVPSAQLWIHSALCAAPRGFSQLIASFIGSQCQGIRPAPYYA